MGPWPRDAHIDNPGALTLGGCIRPKLIVWILHNVILHQTACKAVLTPWELRCCQTCGAHGVLHPGRIHVPQIIVYILYNVILHHIARRRQFPAMGQVPWSKHSRKLFQEWS